MTRRNYTNQELCDQIYSAVWHSEEPMTRRDICTAIKRKKSPHILDMIEHLATNGYFEKTVINDPQWGSAYVYSATNKSDNKQCLDV